MNASWARDVIARELRLADARFTGELEAKRAGRERLRGLLARLDDPAARPGADELRDALGDPDGREVRQALAAWGEGDPRPLSGS